MRRPRACSAYGRPLMRSVRPPNVVPNRMNSEVRNSGRRCFRGRRAAVPTSTPSGVQSVKVAAAGQRLPFWAGCVDRHRSGHDKVPRSRTRFAGQSRGSATSGFTAALSVEFGGFRRCRLARRGEGVGSLAGFRQVRAALVCGVPGTSSVSANPMCTAV